MSSSFDDPLFDPEPIPNRRPYQRNSNSPSHSSLRFGSSSDRTRESQDISSVNCPISSSDSSESESFNDLSYELIDSSCDSLDFSQFLGEKVACSDFDFSVCLYRFQYVMEQGDSSVIRDLVKGKETAAEEMAEPQEQDFPYGEYHVINKRAVEDTVCMLDYIPYEEACNLLTSSVRTSSPSNCQSPFKKEGRYVVVHIESIKGGLRFPLHPFIVNVLNTYILVPGQIVPNSHRILVLFLIACKRLEIEPTMELFQYLFQLSPGTQESEGYVSYQSRSGRKWIDCLPSSHKGWKSKYFFVKLRPEDLPFVNEWSTKVLKLPVPANNPELDETVRAFKALGLHGVDDITAEALAECGIGPPPRVPPSLLQMLIEKNLFPACSIAPISILKRKIGLDCSNKQKSEPSSNLIKLKISARQ